MNRKWTSEKFLFAGAAGLAAALFLRSEYERRTLTEAYYEILTDKPVKKDRTLVFLTDLHNREFGKENGKLISVIDAACPDAVLIGGDMINARDRADILNTIELCENLTAKYPLYYGNGNHEERLDRNRNKYGDLYDTFSAALSDMGAFHLVNSSAMLDNDIRITGLDIGERYYRKHLPSGAKGEKAEMRASYIRSRAGEPSGDCFQILLAHVPEFFDAYASWGADLVFSGHNHGGTIRLPGGVGVMTPQFAFFSRNVVGMKEKRLENGGTITTSRMIISSGLGTHSVNIRLNNKPQVVVVRIRKA